MLASCGERIARKERKAAEGHPQIPSQPVCLSPVFSEEYQQWEAELRLWQERYEQDIAKARDAQQ